MVFVLNRKGDYKLVYGDHFGGVAIKTKDINKFCPFNTLMPTSDKSKHGRIAPPKVVVYNVKVKH